MRVLFCGLALWVFALGYLAQLSSAARPLDLRQGKRRSRRTTQRQSTQASSQQEVVWREKFAQPVWTSTAYSVVSEPMACEQVTFQGDDGSVLTVTGINNYGDTSMEGVVIGSVVPPGAPWGGISLGSARVGASVVDLQGPTPTHNSSIFATTKAGMARVDVVQATADGRWRFSAAEMIATTPEDTRVTAVFRTTDESSPSVAIVTCGPTGYACYATLVAYGGISHDQMVILAPNVSVQVAANWTEWFDAVHPTFVCRKAFCSFVDTNGTLVVIGSTQDRRRTVKVGSVLLSPFANDDGSAPSLLSSATDSVIFVASWRTIVAVSVGTTAPSQPKVLATLAIGSVDAYVTSLMAFGTSSAAVTLSAAPADGTSIDDDFSKVHLVRAGDDSIQVIAPALDVPANRSVTSLHVYTGMSRLVLGFGQGITSRQFLRTQVAAFSVSFNVSGDVSSVNAPASVWNSSTSQMSPFVPAHTRPQFLQLRVKPTDTSLTDIVALPVAPQVTQGVGFAIIRPSDGAVLSLLVVPGPQYNALDSEHLSLSLATLPGFGPIGIVLGQVASTGIVEIVIDLTSPPEVVGNEVIMEPLASIVNTDPASPAAGEAYVLSTVQGRFEEARIVRHFSELPLDTVLPFNFNDSEPELALFPGANIVLAWGQQNGGIELNPIGSYAAAVDTVTGQVLWQRHSTNPTFGLVHPVLHNDNGGVDEARIIFCDEIASGVFQLIDLRSGDLIGQSTSLTVKLSLTNRSSASVIDTKPGAVLLWLDGGVAHLSTNDAHVVATYRDSKAQVASAVFTPTGNMFTACVQDLGLAIVVTEDSTTTAFWSVPRCPSQLVSSDRGFVYGIVWEDMNPFGQPPFRPYLARVNFTNAPTSLGQTRVELTVDAIELPYEVIVEVTWGAPVSLLLNDADQTMTVFDLSGEFARVTLCDLIFGNVTVWDNVPATTQFVSAPSAQSARHSIYSWMSQEFWSDPLMFQQSDMYTGATLASIALPMSAVLYYGNQIGVLSDGTVIVVKGSAAAKYSSAGVKRVPSPPVGFRNASQLPVFPSNATSHTFAPQPTIPTIPPIPPIPTPPDSGPTSMLFGWALWKWGLVVFSLSLLSSVAMYFVRRRLQRRRNQASREQQHLVTATTVQQPPTAGADPSGGGLRSADSAEQILV